ncbi:antitermination protein [Roseibium sediminis]|uniref:antitermination protein n=1 Tax=Roseibium sediminis TaxID=1775174 RepID=UPI00123DB308|nr:antitermination protein [Roseibium sediminis]
MKLITVSALTVAAALTGFAFAMTVEKPTGELRRVDCTKITIFAPHDGKSAEDLCKGYGGVATKNAEPTDEGLVILVRNQPAGGFDGPASVR